MRRPRAPRGEANAGTESDPQSVNNVQDGTETQAERPAPLPRAKQTNRELGELLLAAKRGGTDAARAALETLPPAKEQAPPPKTVREALQRKENAQPLRALLWATGLMFGLPPAFFFGFERVLAPQFFPWMPHGDVIMASGFSALFAVVVVMAGFVAMALLENDEELAALNSAGAGKRDAGAPVVPIPRRSGGDAPNESKKGR
jgi:VMA21-like domain